MTDQEINEAVARKLGYRIGKLKLGKEEYLAITGISERKGFLDEWGRMPDYCHSIAAAWEIVPHLKPLHFIQVWEYPTWCNCRIIREQIVYEDAAETVPMAICLAFLKLP